MQAGKERKTQEYLVASTMQIYAQHLLSTHSCMHAVTRMQANRLHARKSTNVPVPAILYNLHPL